MAKFWNKQVIIFDRASFGDITFYFEMTYNYRILTQLLHFFAFSCRILNKNLLIK